MPLPAVSLFGLNTSYCTNSTPVYLLGNPKGGIFYGEGIDSNQFNPTLTGPGTYSIKYIYVDSNGCEDSSLVQITVNPLPKVIVSPNNPTVCSGIPVILNAMGADYYRWTPGKGLSDSNASSTTADPIVTTTYLVTGMNGDGCSDTAMLTVYVDSIPRASFNGQILNYCDPLTMQFANLSTRGDSYNWDFGDGVTSNELDPQHTYKGAGAYQVTLTVTSEYGCVNDISKEAIILQGSDDLVKIGDAFTPGNYGINSIIAPHVLCSELTGYVFRIYNRWGQLLFQTNDPTAGWDGRFDGQMQLLGVYDYYIEFNCADCKIFKKGNITLLK
jgi:gliding motility-associated-like protein